MFRREKRYADDELEGTIATLWPTCTSAEIARQLGGGISDASVRQHARRLRLERKTGGAIPGQPQQPKPRRASPRSSALPPSWIDAMMDPMKGLPLLSTEIIQATVASAHWRMERERWRQAALARERAKNGMRCACGEPGTPHCPKHRALLQREGVL